MTSIHLQKCTSNDYHLNVGDIGASPDLTFLAEAGQQLGRIPGAVIGRNNPIDIDVYSHQSSNIPGLFAMGPLTGDNFVR